MSAQHTTPASGEHDLPALLDYLARTHGLDLSGYTRTGLMRRSAA